MGDKDLFLLTRCKQDMKYRTEQYAISQQMTVSRLLQDLIRFVIYSPKRSRVFQEWILSEKKVIRQECPMCGGEGEIEDIGE